MPLYLISPEAKHRWLWVAPFPDIVSLNHGLHSIHALHNWWAYSLPDYLTNIGNNLIGQMAFLGGLWRVSIRKNYQYNSKSESFFIWSFFHQLIEKFLLFDWSIDLMNEFFVSPVNVTSRLTLNSMFWINKFSWVITVLSYKTLLLKMIQEVGN